MDYKAIARRCLREINRSTTAPMLLVAYRYYRLFYNLLLRHHVKGIVETDQIIIKAYKRKKRELIPI